MSTFKEELTSLINRESVENASRTPDWILAKFMEDCLFAFEAAIEKREAFFGRGEEAAHV